MRSPEAVSAMLCPVCKAGLAMSDRQGIEIDYCPQCRGVWLDRGELDKIIERSATGAAPALQQQPAPPPQQPWGMQGQPGHHQKPYYKKRKSWLDELFD